MPAHASDIVSQQGGDQRIDLTTPVTTHSALVGVRNAIDASYVSCRRHLSRRVCCTSSYALQYISLMVFIHWSIGQHMFKVEQSWQKFFFPEISFYCPCVQSTHRKDSYQVCTLVLRDYFNVFVTFYHGPLLIN